MSNERKELIIQFVEQAIPFNALIGLKVILYETGDVITKIPFKQELIGDPTRPAIHGGVMSTLLDATGGLVVFSEVGISGRISTVDLRIDYLRPAKPEDILCHAKIQRLGKRLAVVSADIYHDGHKHEPVAIGNAVFNINVKKA